MVAKGKFCRCESRDGAEASVDYGATGRVDGMQGGRGEGFGVVKGGGKKKEGA